MTIEENVMNRYGFKYVKREYPDAQVFPEPKPLYVPKKDEE
jgi:hypothetical protein